MINNLFLSVGAMKSGTTWLYDKLRQHPQIHFSRAKEIHFLAHYYGHTKILSSDKRRQRALAALERLSNNRISSAELERTVAWYNIYTSDPISFEWFEAITDAQQNAANYVADFSNLNCHLTRKDWLEVKKERVNTLKVLYILRDPMARIWSHYKFHLKFSRHRLADCPSQDYEHFKNIIDKPWFWRNSYYSHSILQLTSGLDNSELMIIYFEDMTKNPDATIKRIEDFLGIDRFRYAGDLQSAKNKSSPDKIPKEWESYLSAKIEDEILALRKLGYHHHEWKT